MILVFVYIFDGLVFVLKVLFEVWLRLDGIVVLMLEFMFIEGLGGRIVWVWIIVEINWEYMVVLGFWYLKFC